MAGFISSIERFDMPTQTYYQRPPAIQAIQFDGENALELATLTGAEEPVTGRDDDGRYATITPPPSPGRMSWPMMFRETDWLVINSGSFAVFSDDAFNGTYTR